MERTREMKEGRKEGNKQQEKWSRMYKQRQEQTRKRKTDQRKKYCPVQTEKRTFKVGQNMDKKDRNSDT